MPDASDSMGHPVCSGSAPNCGSRFLGAINEDEASKDRYSLLLIWIVNLSAIALGIWAAHRLTQLAIPVSNVWFVIGLCVLAFGLSLRWYSVYYLGRYFTTTVSIAADHHLIETGPYRFIRHPSYAGALWPCSALLEHRQPGLGADHDCSRLRRATVANARGRTHAARAPSANNTATTCAAPSVNSRCLLELPHRGPDKNP